MMDALRSKTPITRRRGFTLIEMMITVAIIAVLIAVAAPSFIRTLAKQRIEGVAAELSTDLQYARSEAVQRNVPVRVIAGSNCYVVHAVGTTDATGCATLGAGAVALKTVTTPSDVSLAFVSNNATPKAFIEFDPLRGMAVDAAGGDSSGYVTVSSSGGNWEIRADVTVSGRIKSCTPNGSLNGVPSC